MKTDLEMFREMFDCSDPAACWVRRDTQLSKWDYDRFTVDGVNIGAHRAAWIIFNGPIPEKMHVCHHCDNGPCGNPAHLFLGTPSENRLDWVKKGKRKMPEGAVTSRSTYITAISFTPQILKLGRIRAKSLRQSFSGYLETLVKQDIGEKRAKATV